MDDHRSVRPNHQPYQQYQHYDPPSLTLPRSQYAANVRPSPFQVERDNIAPRYFSSPFRSPLRQQDRHDSMREHQRTVSSVRGDANLLPRSQYQNEPDRSSYSFFGPGAATAPLSVSKQSRPISSDQDKSDSASQSSQDQLGVVRQASIGHKAKPALTNVKRSDSSQTRKPFTEPRTPPLRPTAIDALSAAITAVNQHPKQPSQNHLSQMPGSHGQPFDSPTSTYSQDQPKHRRAGTGLNITGVESGRVSPLAEEAQLPQDVDSTRASPLPGPTPYSEKSVSSTKPLLGPSLGDRAMNRRIPENVRPQNLDMGAVRDLEARGSITSLPDLIRRATKLAANLDRGKTASRLWMWDMFSNTDHANHRKQESSYTDVLDSFPDPGIGAQSKTPRPATTWPTETKPTVLVSEKEQRSSTSSARKCCGLSMSTFIFVLVILIVLIAAAVLIPIFLVAVPRQSTSSLNLKNCAASYACQNKGISIVDNNACSCVCINGFTGNDCSKETDPNCITANIVDGSHTYNNATLGTSIVTLLQQVQGKMNIPLNASTLLSVFASNNLSCASENSLVDFNFANRRKQRRFVIVPGLEPDGLRVPNVPVPHRITQSIATRTAAVLAARQTATGTSNEIVYQATSLQVSATASDSASATSSGSTSSSIAVTTKANVTSDQLEFAQLVVLYVLAGSRVPSTAVVAQQNIEQYFRAGALNSGNSTVDIVRMGNMQITANFAELAIILSNGKIVGGTKIKN